MVDGGRVFSVATSLRCVRVFLPYLFYFILIFIFLVKSWNHVRPLSEGHRVPRYPVPGTGNASHVLGYYYIGFHIIVLNFGLERLCASLVASSLLRRDAPSAPVCPNATATPAREAPISTFAARCWSSGGAAVSDLYRITSPTSYLSSSYLWRCFIKRDIISFSTMNEDIPSSTSAAVSAASSWLHAN